MPLWKSNSAARDALAQSAAISRSQAVIEFKMDGTIITANQNFLDAMGYRLDEIRTSIIRCSRRRICAAATRTRRSGRGLNRGEFQAAEYKRIGKGGREVWIRRPTIRFWTAPAGPSKSSNSPPTSRRRNLRNMEDAGKISAIGRARAVDRFNLDGTIITANENFLTRWATGWRKSGASIIRCSWRLASATAPPIEELG
jgi:methyl-accepting chemotaxis protein